MTLEGTSSMALTYGVYQRTGQDFQQWIENDPSKAPGPCPVRPCKLDIKDIPTWQRATYPCHVEHHDPSVGRSRMEIEFVPRLIKDQAKRIGMGKLTNRTFVKVIASECRPGADPRESWKNYWEGIMAPGCLFIEQMFRNSGPFASEISTLLYREHFPLDSLRHVFLMDIINADTKRFVATQLYVPSNGLSWPDPEHRVWELGTADFEVLLGTRLGGFVARLVLGAFEKGSRQISRIVTWCENGHLQMRFDIEEQALWCGSLDGAAVRPVPVRHLE